MTPRCAMCWKARRKSAARGNKKPEPGMVTPAITTMTTARGGPSSAGAAALPQVTRRTDCAVWRSSCPPAGAAACCGSRGLCPPRRGTGWSWTSAPAAPTSARAANSRRGRFASSARSLTRACLTPLLKNPMEQNDDIHQNDWKTDPQTFTILKKDTW